MPDEKAAVWKLKDIALHLGCPYEGDGEVEITGVASLENARRGDLVFVGQEKFRKRLEETQASAAVVPADMTCGRLPAIKSPQPRMSFIKAVGLFFSSYRPGPGIHPLASVSPSARLGKDVSVGALSHIGDDVEIGDETVIFPLVSIYPRARVGRESRLHSHVSVREDSIIGDRVIIHNGAVIGADGFGYLRAEDGSHVKIPQKGRVIIEDDVEIGANATIDRAALDETVVRRGTKIDNLVMVAHNVEVGANSILVAQVGIAGSSKVGKNVILGGQVGVSDHIEIGDAVVAAAKSGIIKNIPDGAVVAGFPNIDIREWRKMWVLLPRIHDYVKEIKALRAKVEELEKKVK